MPSPVSNGGKSHIYTPWVDDGLLTRNERWFFFWAFVAVLANLVAAVGHLVGAVL